MSIERNKIKFLTLMIICLIGDSLYNGATILYQHINYICRLRHAIVCLSIWCLMTTRTLPRILISILRGPDQVYVDHLVPRFYIRITRSGIYTDRIMRLSCKATYGLIVYREYLRL